MAKRGESGLSRLIAVNKPVGMSSHDVVNHCRRIFGERRVGHTGTLDPLASGVLVVCVGPATRLDAYMVGHGKRYKMGVRFGIGTETDDVEGAITKECPIPSEVYEEEYARTYVQNMVGKGTQIPPVYSAIKVNGRKSYEAARKETVINLEPREFEIYDAKLDEVRVFTDEEGRDSVEWIVEMSVSKGTYMRAIARDMGRDLKTAAHVSSLERTISGTVTLEECATLEMLEESPNCGTIDPLRALGVRYAFVRDQASKVENGTPLNAGDVALNEPITQDVFAPCCCTTSVIASSTPPKDGEVVGIVVQNHLKALYEYHESEHRYRSRCVFSIGVERGTAL